MANKPIHLNKPKQELKLGEQTTRKSTPEETAQLDKEVAKRDINLETKFKDVKDKGVSNVEFAEGKRKAFAEEHPLQQKFLEVAAPATAMGALGVGVLKALTATSSVATGGLSAKAGTAIQKGFTNQKIFNTIMSMSEKLNVAQKVALTAGKTATNAKTAAATTSLLMKAGMALGVATFAATLAGSYVFAPFQIVEGSDKIGMAIFMASKQGEWELVKELTEYQAQLTDPEVWEKVVYQMPIKNAADATVINLKAAKVGNDAFAYLAQKALEQQETGDTDAQKWDKINKEIEEERKRIIKDDEERYSRYAKNAAEAKSAARKEEAAFWDKIMRDRNKRIKQEREENEAYWTAIRTKGAMAEGSTVGTGLRGLNQIR